VKAQLEIGLLREKVDQLREREVLKLTDPVRMLAELLEQSAPGACSPMRKADDHHNPQQSTSWRDFISYSPRDIRCFSGTLLIRRQ
jgi:hypothetical protein